MTTLDGAHVLVLGATGGLGSAIAHELAAAGARLTLSARTSTRLDELATALGECVVTTVAADLTTPDAPARIVAQAVAAAPLSGVVNAAGVVAFGASAELDDDTLDDLLLLNLIAPIRVVREAVSTLGAGGFIVQISAVVAERPTAGMAAYSAAKAGLTAFDAAAAAELRRRRIRVLDVRPPHTETGLVSRALAGDAPKLPEGLAPEVTARRIVDAIEAGQFDVPAEDFSA